MFLLFKKHLINILQREDAAIVERIMPTPQEAIELIKNSGGVPVLAHLMFYKKLDSAKKENSGPRIKKKPALLELKLTITLTLLLNRNMLLVLPNSGVFLKQAEQTSTVRTNHIFPYLKDREKWKYQKVFSQNFWLV